MAKEQKSNEQTYVFSKDDMNQIDYRLLGDKKEEEGEHEEASFYYQKAIELGDNDPYLYLYVGVEKTNPEEEIFYFEKAIELGAKEAWIYSHTGNLKYQFKEYKEAKRYLEKAIDLGTDDPDSKNILIKCNYWIKREEHK